MPSRMTELLELTRVRILVFWREPEAVFWVFVFPLIMAMILGLAFRGRGVETEKIGVVVEPGARGLVEALEATPHVDVERFETNADADHRLRAGKISALILPGDPITLRFDPTRPESETARLRVEDAIQRYAGREDAATIRRDEVTETGSRYIDWLIPGLVGMNIMGTGIWGIGFGIVDARQKKLLKRLIVTPMRRSSFLFAFMVSRIVYLVLEVSLLLVFAHFVLGVPIYGALVDLMGICLLGALCFAGLGLLVAARPRTIEGVSGLMNMVMVPMWLCSGVFFSYDRFPEVLHPLIEALPLTALNNALRGVCMDGQGLLAMIPALGTQVIWGLGCFFIALRVFRWQ